MIGKLITGIADNLPQLLSSAINIYVTIKKGILSGLVELKKTGIYLVQGIWDGISGSLTWIKNKISGWIGNITAFIKNLFGIHSPSTLFRDEIGINLGYGIGDGFEDSLNSVYRDMKRAVDKQNSKLTSNLTSQHQITVTNEDNRQSTLSSIDNNREIRVNSTLEVDGKQMASVVNKVNTKQRLQYGVG